MHVNRPTITILVHREPFWLQYHPNLLLVSSQTHGCHLQNGSKFSPNCHLCYSTVPMSVAANPAAPKCWRLGKPFTVSPLDGASSYFSKVVMLLIATSFEEVASVPNSRGCDDTYCLSISQLLFPRASKKHHVGNCGPVWLNTTHQIVIL